MKYKGKNIEDCVNVVEVLGTEYLPFDNSFSHGVSLYDVLAKLQAFSIKAIGESTKNCFIRLKRVKCGKEVKYRLQLVKCRKENEEERSKRIETEKRKIDAEDGRRMALKSEIERAKRLLSENGYIVTENTNSECL